MYFSLTKQQIEAFGGVRGALAEQPGEAAPQFIELEGKFYAKLSNDSVNAPIRDAVKVTRLDGIGATATAMKNALWASSGTFGGKPVHAEYDLPTPQTDNERENKGKSNGNSFDPAFKKRKRSENLGVVINYQYNLTEPQAHPSHKLVRHNAPITAVVADQENEEEEEAEAEEAPKPKKKKKREVPIHWTQAEQDYLLQLVEQKISELNRPLVRVDWVPIARLFNEYFAGQSVSIGDPLTKHKNQDQALLAEEEWDYPVRAPRALECAVTKKGRPLKKVYEKMLLENIRDEEDEEE